nr:methenyltetrahydrofolate synthase domain-containing protein-like [Cherax quadricarinatus]
MKLGGCESGEQQAEGQRQEPGLDPYNHVEASAHTDKSSIQYARWQGGWQAATHDCWQLITEHHQPHLGCRGSCSYSHVYIKRFGIEVADIPTLTKHDIRDKVWSHIEDHDLATFPRPVSNRIPNFKGAGEAGQRVCNLQCFTSAQTIKVNPDKPQEEVRFLTLEAGKILLVPTPRLRSGLFNRMDGHSSENKENLRVMAQTEGMKKHSKPVGLDMGIKVDLIVIGSVAVSLTGKIYKYIVF